MNLYQSASLKKIDTPLSGTVRGVDEKHNYSSTNSFVNNSHMATLNRNDELPSAVVKL